jgi:hypothetical protein
MLFLDWKLVTYPLIELIFNNEHKKW